LRRRIAEPIKTLGVDEAVDTQVLQLAASALKLKDSNPFTLDMERVMAICNEEGCLLFTIKKLRANIGLQCNKCKEEKKQHRTIAKRKETNKKKCVAPNSRCPMKALDDAERTTRTSNLHYQRQ